MQTLKHGTPRSPISWRIHWYLHLFSPIIVKNYMDECALLSKCPSYYRRLQATKKSSHWFCNLFHFWENFSVFMRNVSEFLHTQLLTTIYLSARGITAASWMKNLDLIRFLGIPHTILPFFASEVLDNHKSVLTSFGIKTNDDELDLPYYIYCIPRCRKIPINIHSLPVQPGVPPSLYPFSL